MKWLPLLLAGCWLLVPAVVRAQDRQEKLRQIAQEAAKSFEARKDSGSPGAAARMREANQVLAQFREAILDGREANLLFSLSQLPLYLDSESSRKECDKLAEEIRAEVAASQQKTRGEVESAIRDIPALMRAAKAPADLDAIIARLEQHSRRSPEQDSSSVLQAAVRDAQAALRSVKQWQDYLSARQRSDQERMRRALSDLLSDDQTHFLPRSEILARMYPVPEPAEKPVPSPQELDARSLDLLAQIKTLDDLAPALDRFDKLSHDENDPLRSFLSTARDQLLPISQKFAAFKSGESVNVGTSEFRFYEVRNSSFEARPAPPPTAAQLRAVQQTSIRLQAQMLLLALPRYLNLPDSARAQPDETAVAFLERVRKEALAAEDYLLAAQAEETKVFLRSGVREGSERRQAGIFIIASRQDTARQYALAVASYERALAAEGSSIPAKVIGQRLDAIKTSNPQEFQQGMEMFVSPPNLNRNNFPFGGAVAPGGPPGRLQPTPAPALQIPAATSKPAPAK